MAWTDPEHDRRRAWMQGRIGQGDTITVDDIVRQFGCRAHEAKYDLEQVLNIGPVGKTLRIAVIARDGWVCQYCDRDVKRVRYGWAIDHVVPRSLGGKTAPYNLVMSCGSCNRRKRQHTWIPRNLAEITTHHPDWRELIEAAATPITVATESRINRIGISISDIDLAMLTTACARTGMAPAEFAYQALINALAQAGNP